MKMSYVTGKVKKKDDHDKWGIFADGADDAGNSVRNCANC